MAFLEFPETFGITQVLYIPVYLQPWYRRAFGYAPGKCPNAEEFYSRALSLPLYPAMSDADVEKVIQAVKNALVFEKLKAKMLTKVE